MALYKAINTTYIGSTGTVAIFITAVTAGLSEARSPDMTSPIGEQVHTSYLLFLSCRCYVKRVTGSYVLYTDIVNDLIIFYANKIELNLYFFT
ncbi:hypothetical protein C0J52_25533 [Blattella germanica]|nr:hypothetical protein C0J52_25533 [Blattella germanica]